MEANINSSKEIFKRSDGTNIVVIGVIRILDNLSFEHVYNLR